MIYGYLGPHSGGGSRRVGRKVVQDTHLHEMDVRRTVENRSHVGILLVDQSRGRHCVHLHTGGYFLDIRNHIDQMKFKGIVGVLQKIAAQFDGDHLGGAEDGIEACEVGGGEGEGKSGSIEVGAGDGD